MRIDELYTSKKNYLYEGLTTSSLRNVMLWESVGQAILEAQLTPNQVLQIFQQAEQAAAASGANRTLLGKGKDVASAVNRAFQDLKAKAQASGPVQNLDALYDRAAEKLKQATGGDQGVMQYVEKYRAFAKKHPVAQSFIYAALIAAAGISGAGLGGGAALGLFKTVDKLLQGEKFSSAAASGIKTGAVAGLAGHVGQSFGAEQGADAVAGGPSLATPNDIVQQIRSGQIVDQEGLLSAIGDAKNKGTIWKVLQAQAGMPGSSDVNQVIQSIAGNTGLKESQVRKVFALTAVAQLNEGIADAAKGVIGKAGQWLQTKGHNLASKVTADKLAQAWERAGSPMDSNRVAAVLKAQGVADDVISSVYSAMRLPVPQVQPSTPTKPSATPAATSSATDASASTTAVNNVDQLLSDLTDYVEQGGSITPKQRGAIKNLWMRIGGTQIAENKRKKNTP